MNTITKNLVGKTCFAMTALALAVGSAVAAPVATQTMTAAVSAASNEISAAQLQAAQQKLGHAQQIVAQFADRASAEGLPEAWRMEMINNLMKSPESSFAQVQSAATAHAALSTAGDLTNAPASTSSDASAKVLGDTGDDLTFIPLPTPCRIVDTRASGAGGALAAGATRVFSFVGSATTQGGSTTCTPFGGYVGGGVPGAAALNITVDATGSPAAPGSFLAAFADGGTLGASWLNFAGGQIIANQGIVGISTGYKFDIKVNGQTNVIVDVFGSFVRPAATAFDCVGTVNTVNSIGAGVQTFYYAPACTAGYTAVGTYCYTGVSGIYSTGSGITGEQAFCAWRNTTGAAGNTSNGAKCCRVPGR
jgi:hypothetical protein